MACAVHRIVSLLFGLAGVFLSMSSANAQSFYRVVEKQGVWWFAKPGGGEMFSLGVDCVDPGQARETYRIDRPAYAAFRYYADNASWAKETLARLRAWNFNTLGGWCDLDALKTTPDAEMPYTVVLHLGASVNVPWCDVFSADTGRRIDDLARKLVTPHRDDSQLIGYFSDNELGWWDDSLFVFFLRQPRQNSARRVLLSLLRQQYHNDFSLLKRNFYTDDARSFSDLDRRANLMLRPGGDGEKTVKQFVYLFARRYYQLIHDAIRRYDTNHLLLGDRYAQSCPLEVARAAGEYVDVISTNYGADWPDGGISHFYLEGLHRMTGKPVLISEFYFCARENRSGNKNSSDGFPVVSTQMERAASVRNNVTALAGTPYVLGAHWFQYYDEPAFGRADGENYNMGLVDIDNRPYEYLTAAFAQLHIDKIHSDSSAPVMRNSIVPPAPRNPMEGLQVWGRARAYVPGRSQSPIADLYVCWCAQRLYLAVYTEEYADAKLYRRGQIPLRDRMTWTIYLPGNISGSRKAVQIRFGPGGPTRIGGNIVDCHTLNNGIRYTAVIALSPAQWGLSALRSGTALALHTSLTSHGHAECMEWKTTLRLSSK